MKENFQNLLDHQNQKMDENALVDRVFMRIVSAESDEAFQATLHKFLPPVLLKLASPQEHVRKKVMELLVHVNKRLKSRQSVTLPVRDLFTQYTDANNSPMITNFSLVYIKMGLPRLSTEELSSIIPDVIQLLPSKPASLQETFIAIILPTMGRVTFPTDPVKRRQLYGLPDDPSVRSLLLGYMLDVLLMPYSINTPSGDDHTPPHPPAPLSPPCFSANMFKRIMAMNPNFSNPIYIEEWKIGLIKYVVSEVFPLKEITLHLVIAAADNRYLVATKGEDELKKVSSDIDWEDAALIKRLVTIYLGTANQISRDRNAPPPAKESVVTEAPTRMKSKIFPFFLKSKYAAQMFPQNLQIACDALAAPDTKLKLKKFGIEFIAKMADHALPHHLKAIAPTLISYLWKMTEEVAASSNCLRPLAYSAMGKLVHSVPSLIFDKVDIVSKLFTRLENEADKSVRPSIQDALMAMTSSISKARQDVKEIIGKLLATNIESECESVRRVSVHMAHNSFHTTWLPTRYLLLLAASDRLPDIQVEAKKLLHSKRRIEMPIAEHSFDLDLYPSFEQMSAYIESKRVERVMEGKTLTRGTQVIAFKPETLYEIVSYLRTCLAKSCAISEPHTKEPADWMEQAPIISKYSSRSNQSSERKGGDADPPSKQHKGEGDSMHKSLLQYCHLLMQCIAMNTSSDTVYLLLELVATHRSIASELLSKVDWFRTLANNYDSKVQVYAAELLAIVVIESKGEAVEMMKQCIDEFKPTTMTVEQLNGSLHLMSSLISYHNRLRDGESGADSVWTNLTASVVKLIEPLLHDSPKAMVPLQVLLQISVSGSLCIDHGSEESLDGEVNALSIIKLLSAQVKSAKLDSKQRERVATCLGSIGVGDKNFPHRKLCIDSLCESSSTKELELHFTVGQALVMSAQGVDCSERRDRWRQSESEYWSEYTLTGCNVMSYLVDSVLDKYTCHVNPHIKQAACVWLLTIIKKSAKFPSVMKRSSDIQSAFMRLLTDNDEITQDVASKGLGLVYDSCDEQQQKELISSLVGTLMRGKSTLKKSGEVSKETKLFSEGSLGATPDGQGLNTYKELCAIATDLNQPDLIYKFLHLANHQSMWNSRKGAAFGFSTIAAQAGAQLAPYMSQIVPRLYRYTFDPNVKIQTAMRAIWNAVVKETKPAVDKYASEILSDLLNNLTNNQWRVRESCCLAVNDLLRGRQLDNVLEQLPSLWHVMMKLLDDIKESTRLAATTASKTLSKVTIKICDINYGKSGEKALSLILPVLLSEGITSNVAEVQALSLETVVSMSKNAGAFLKPHIAVLVPIMLESLSGLESQSLNYLALRVSGREEVEQRLDKARVAASKMSPMMDSINLCIQQVDSTVLAQLVPRLTDLIKSSIGLGTKVGIASVISALCTHCGLESMQPFTGKCMTALFNGLTDRNLTIRKNYAMCMANVCKLAKDSSVEKLLGKLRTWYMDKEDDTLSETCGIVLKAMADVCPDTLNNHKSQVLPLVFLAMHSSPMATSTSTSTGSTSGSSTGTSVWKEIWSEVTIGTDSAVRLYIEEFISITDTALQSASWNMKAQAASAMGTIAKSAGSNISISHLSQLMSSLLAGLSGRTWNGKEALLTALSDVTHTCSDLLTSADSTIDTDELVKACLKEASKDSLSYKVWDPLNQSSQAARDSENCVMPPVQCISQIPAVNCVSKVLESLKVDKYNELYNIVTPYLNMDKHEDEDITDTMLINFRETGFLSLGRAWPLDHHVETQKMHMASTTSMLLDRLPHVTWKEQLAVWNTLTSIIYRSKLSEMSSDSGWSLSSFSDQLVSAALKSASESKYSSIREAACKCVKQLILAVKGVTPVVPSKQARDQLIFYLTQNAPSDSSLVVKRLSEEIKQNILDNNPS